MIEKISFEKMVLLNVDNLTKGLTKNTPKDIGEAIGLHVAAVLATIVEEVNNKIDEINKEIYRLGASSGQNGAYIEGLSSKIDEKFDLIDNCLQELKNRIDVAEEGISHLQRRTDVKG